MVINSDRIAPVYKNQHVLITGGLFQFNLKNKFKIKLLNNLASGFMGKIFFERILRCTEAEKIYLLLRPKRGVDPKVRIHEMFNNSVSDGDH